MPRVHAYHVSPKLSERLHCLKELALNLRWSWDHSTIELFRRLDRDLWETTGHNPSLMLGTINQKRLAAAEKDEAFLAYMDRVYGAFTEYMKDPGWFGKNYPEHGHLRIAYFSAEFGLTECFPNYAGGLGILAGDHMKSASDLGLPLVGVGLLYQEGYFRQYLNTDGWQQEKYPKNDFYNLPIQPVVDDNRRPMMISIEFPGRRVQAKIWRAQVGRVPLYLMDTNIGENSAEDRQITDSLYGGDREHRLKQEIFLGIGGMQVLRTLKIDPDVCHMNEGHSAFLALERTRHCMQDLRLNYQVARQVTSAGNLFTTHTPVPAGFDVFDRGLMNHYFGSYLSSLGISFDQLMAFGCVNPANLKESLNMAYLAARHSSYSTAVSRLHATTTRKMAQGVYAGFPEPEVPIDYVTNGIHTRSWISQEMSELLSRYLGPRWLEDPSDMRVWDRINDIPDEELWRTHERRKERLIAYARRKLADQLKQRGAPESEILLARGALNSETLTIGFARRFATYKRATLLLLDAERLRARLLDPVHPVQLMIAGKAHPRDDAGKELIRQLIHFASDPEIRRRVVFLEDYDMSVARYIVQGVDVWLNTPRRPNEASGTSGMKALANGGLNLSILDGWWDEAYRPGLGWAIGNGEEYGDHGYQDRVECNALYNLLEREILPLFYARGDDGLPRKWIACMKASMRHLSPVYNTNRMVAEYAQTYYIPASTRHRSLLENGAQRARAIVEWRKRVRQDWGSVRIENVDFDGERDIHVGTSLKLTARIRLGKLRPGEVRVQAYQGALDAEHQIRDGAAFNLALEADEGSGLYRYGGDIPCVQSGLCGFSVRVLPFHEDAMLPFELPLIAWAD